MQKRNVRVISIVSLVVLSYFVYQSGSRSRALEKHLRDYPLTLETAEGHFTDYPVRLSLIRDGHAIGRVVTCSLLCERVEEGAENIIDLTLEMFSKIGEEDNDLEILCGPKSYKRDDILSDKSAALAPVWHHMINFRIPFSQIRASRGVFLKSGDTVSTLISPTEVERVILWFDQLTLERKEGPVDFYYPIDIRF